MKIFGIHYAELEEDDGRYLASALVIKLFGLALVIAVGRKR